MINKSRLKTKSVIGRLMELFLIFRAFFFIGTKYTCPCCGWRVRTFTKGGGSFKTRSNGYCPRCNSKARHRRIWLYLKHQTNLFSEPLRLFHISPQYSLSRRLISMSNLDYVGADIQDRANISLKMDISTIPIKSDLFDVAICIHVLEHVRKDRLAMQELYRVLKPGGWALISVPIRLDQKTFEDPSIVTSAARERAYGEKDHKRLYGNDLIEQLRTYGFEVQLDLGEKIDHRIMEKYGLLNDENIFFVRKGES